MKMMPFLLALGVAAVAAAWWWPKSGPMVGNRSIDEWTERLEDPDASLRAETLLSIADLGWRARPLLPYLKALTRDPHPVARGRAVLAVVTVDKNEAELPLLLRALRDPSSAVRMDAVTGLQLFGKAGIPGLIFALEDPDPTVLIDAALGLGRMGPAAADAVPALTKLRRHRNYHISGAARDALALIEPASTEHPASGGPARNPGERSSVARSPAHQHT
jgi:HEAT repeat protein